MIDNTGMYQGYSVEGEIKVSKDDNKSCNINGPLCTPIYECPEERCVHRQIIHEVPQV